MSHRPTGAAAAREVLLFVGKGPNVVERAAVLPVQRERWAKLAKRTTAELDGRPSSNRPAPKRTAPRYPARVAQIVAARLPRRTDQILDLCAAYTGQRRRPATPLERHLARS